MNGYFLNYIDEAGNPQTLELTGDETITTTCGVCGREHDLEFYEFCSIFGTGERILPDTMVRCRDCSTGRA